VARTVNPVEVWSLYGSVQTRVLEVWV